MLNKGMIAERCYLAKAVVDEVTTYAEYLVRRGRARKTPYELLVDVEIEIERESIKKDYLAIDFMQ